ncbi:hypothetical protein [Xylella fastidiosa]|uniref:hypothetical protein n=1 Tax=Xylella fastidiosa TaxID=2371 RepID=UPI003AFB2B4B
MRSPACRPHGWTRPGNRHHDAAGAGSGAMLRPGGVIHQTIDHPEIPTAPLALRIAARELRARSVTPLRTFELKTTRASLRTAA